jgi:hypothetical protein
MIDFAEAKSLIAEIQGADLALCTEDWIMKRLLPLMRHDYKLVALPDYGSEHWWYRAQICCDGGKFDSLRRMIYAPSNIARMGRANLEGRSTHYSSWNLQTVLSEVHVKPGDLVQVIISRSSGVRPIPTVVLGELAYLMQAGRSLINAPSLSNVLESLMRQATPEQIKYWHLIDAFLADTFRRNLGRSPEDYEYKVSASIANRIHSSDGALAFPSVRAFGAVNIAVPAALFDSAFEVIATVALRVTDDLGFSVYTWKQEAHANTFAPDGQIFWDRPSPTAYSVSSMTGLRVSPARQGWRVPAS